MLKPVFLVGCERSGTTMLRLMLNHHPQLAFHHEMDFAVTLLPHIGFPDMEEYRESLFKDRIFIDSHFQLDSSFSYQETLNHFLQQLMERENKPLVGAKIHHSFDRLPDVWPDCRFIHMVRDPRDVSRSIVQMGWEGNVWCAARWWKEAEETWDRLRSRLKQNDFMEVRFRDVVARPEEVLQEICRFLAVTYSKDMLSYQWMSTYRAPDISLVDQWKTKLTNDQVGLVESQVGELLELRGYERSILPPRNVSFIRKQLLKLQSRFGKMRFRIQRYGLWLTIQDVCSRKLGFPSLQETVRERMWEIERRHLK